MANDEQSKPLTIAQAAILRAQASDLLNRLIADRHASEQRMAEIGKRDAMKTITGRTCFDTAIESAREMVARMDAVLASANGRAAAAVEVEEAGVSLAVRPRVRQGSRPKFVGLPVAAAS